jgi:hypothetical protein
MNDISGTLPKAMKLRKVTAPCRDNKTDGERTKEKMYNNDSLIWCEGFAVCGGR